MSYFGIEIVRHGCKFIHFVISALTFRKYGYGVGKIVTMVFWSSKFRTNWIREK